MPVLDGSLLLVVGVAVIGSAQFVRVVAKEKHRRDRELELEREAREKAKARAAGSRITSHG